MEVLLHSVHLVCAFVQVDLYEEKEEDDEDVSDREGTLTRRGTGEELPTRLHVILGLGHHGTNKKTTLVDLRRCREEACIVRPDAFAWPPSGLSISISVLIESYQPA